MEKDILNKLNELSDRMERLERDIDYLKGGSDKMTRHISFVESIYNRIKDPFYYIIAKIEGTRVTQIKDS